MNNNELYFTGIIVAVILLIVAVLSGFSFSDGATEFKNVKSIPVSNTTYNLDGNITFLKVYDDNKIYTENEDYTIDRETGVFQITNDTHYLSENVQVVYKYQKYISVNMGLLDVPWIFKTFLIIAAVCMSATLIVTVIEGKHG